MKIKFEIEFDDGEKIVSEDTYVNENNPIEFFQCFAPYNSESEARRASKLLEDQNMSVKDFVKDNFEGDATNLFEEYWYFFLTGNIEEIGWDAGQDFSTWQR